MNTLRERTMDGAKDRGRRRARPGHWIVIAMLLSMSACDRLLEISVPGNVEEAELADPSLIGTLVTGALGKAECSLSQYAYTTAKMSGEYLHGSSWRPVNVHALRLSVIDEYAGQCPPAGSSAGGVFLPIQEARAMAADAYERILGFADDQVADRDRNLAKLAAYGGYAHVWLSEGFCEMTLDSGPRMTRDEVMAIAEQRFTTALQHAADAGDDDLRQMAHAGRARARLMLGNLTGAAEDARQVSEGYVRYAEHSSAGDGRRQNRIWETVNFGNFITVAPEYRDLEVDGVPDPRVPVVNTGEPGQDGSTPQWNQLKFPSASSPMPIASWEEAQLIIAEAEGGQAAVDAINRLRAQADLPFFESSDPAEIQAQVLEERRRQLFSEGHRLNDMIRHDIPFPTGASHRGEPYGNETCLPLPQAEVQNNPNL